MGNGQLHSLKPSGGIPATLHTAPAHQGHSPDFCAQLLDPGPTGAPGKACQAHCHDCHACTCTISSDWSENTTYIFQVSVCCYCLSCIVPAIPSSRLLCMYTWCHDRPSLQGLFTFLPSGHCTSQYSVSQPFARHIFS